MKKIIPSFLLLSLMLLLTACSTDINKKEEVTADKTVDTKISPLKIAENHHYFTTNDDKPFFWLGDTAWLMFSKLTREEIVAYFDKRKEQGFNVIQVMTLHTLSAVNIYGDSALVNQNVAKPMTTPGATFSEEEAYDFWDHVDFAVKTAEEKGLYMAMVPVWGNNVKSGKVSVDQAASYAKFLANRYKSFKNVIWLNGGDTFGNEFTDVWNTIGITLKKENPDKLITFHPRGRMQSSDWFHNEDWLDFNLIQSGHRRYDQDDSERSYGEDNWKYILTDFYKEPFKPTLDGEPSYEGIPQGLHDTLQPFWKAKDVRRYGYWSVFAGAAGYTYGHSAVMQMQSKDEKTGAYGNKLYWKDALTEEGANQMHYLKELMLDYPFESGEPDTTLVVDQGKKHAYIPAIKGKGYTMFYDYSGRPFQVNLDKVLGTEIEASWFNPRNGEKTTIGSFKKNGIQKFTPEGGKEEGNDWVLILTSKS